MSKESSPMPDQRSEVNGPPRAPLAFRVGVTGHRPGCTEKRPDPDVAALRETAGKKKRPDPDVAALRETAGKILQHIADVFKGVADTHPHLFDCSADSKQPGRRGTLRVISALAAGADQWVAEEAIARGYELQSPLPFSRDEYAEDFKREQCKSAYEKLLDKAAAVLELDGKWESDEAGKRQRDPRSYKAVGRVLLEQSDILMALWDGNPENGEGGTGQVVMEALERGIPVITIGWTAPQTWRILLPRWRLVKRPEDIQEKGDWAQLTREVQSLLLPPEAKLESHSKGMREEYFCERRKGFCFHICRLPIFRSVVNWRLPSSSLNDSVILQKWKKNPYNPHYDLANDLSIYYASLYRSSFVLNYFLGALAVFLALFGVMGWNEKPGIIAELVSIVMVLFITWRGHKGRWHKRWIDYRMLAERLRLASSLALFGGGGQPVSMAGHLASYGNPAATWMHWHYRAIERAAGLLPVVFNEVYLTNCKEHWLKLIKEQMDYHTSNSERFNLLDRRLHKWSSCLFVATFFVCVFHLFHPKWMNIKATSDLMSSLAAILPALGAACAGIRSQGEFQRVAQRSEAMRDSLDQIQLDFASVAPRPNELASVRLYECAQRVVDLMAKEMLDWRVVFQDRPLTLPS